MKKQKTLILPEVYSEVNTGWPSAVVKRLSETTDDYFEFIKINWTLDRVKKENKNFILKVLSKWIYHIKYIHIIINLITLYIKLVKYWVGAYKKVISHDMLYSFIIVIFFPRIKLINIYHWQGALYYEMTDLLWQKKSKLLKLLIEFIERKVYDSAYRIGFPSIGSLEALYDTHSQMKSVIEKRKDDPHILHNWISIDYESISHSPILEEHILSDWINFVTVWTLNEAKWADRIPEFLWSVKKKWIKFSWTIVWRGAMRKTLIENIELNNIVSESHLLEQAFPKNEILWLFERTDCYILFHRYSIFDLATLEAMLLWNIPILSNIGWNKEMIIDENGLLINPPDFWNSAENFIKFIEGKLDQIKLRNTLIVKEYFNNKRFSQLYIDIDNSL